MLNLTYLALLHVLVTETATVFTIRHLPNEKEFTDGRVLATHPLTQPFAQTT